MGANYWSFQAPDTPTAVIRQTLAAFNAEGGRGLAAYLAPPIGRWTAVYPKFSPEMDLFAKRLSKSTNGVVLTLGSFDEDHFVCNVCVCGKDTGHFRANIGTQRRGKQREPVIRKLDALQAFAEPDARAALAERLCDLREIVFSRYVLIDFCRTFGISNARCSFDYVQKNDYEADLDQIVPLELVEPDR